MTEIGKMIRDEAIKEGIQEGMKEGIQEGIKEGIQEGIKEGIQEGIKEGIKEGKAEGKADILIKQLIKKFKSVPSEYKEKIKKLPEETIDVIATDIFDMDNIADIERYF